MKRQSTIQHLSFLSLILFLINIYATGQNQFIQTASRDNSYCNSTCTLLNIPELNNNPAAIILATPLVDNGINLNPHPIGVHFINEKWSIINLDQKSMPAGSKFTVQYFLNPDAELQFIQRADKLNLKDNNTRSFINNPNLNNNPDAKFRFIVTGVGSGSVISEIGMQYDNSAGQWYIYNTNGKPLDNSVACNISIEKGAAPEKMSTSTAATAVTPLATLQALAAFGDVQLILMTVEGTAQSWFKGEASTPGQTNKIGVAGFTLENNTPVDLSSGQATGKRSRLPVIINKSFSVSSLQFYKAQMTNENLKTVTIEFYTTAPNGTSALVYKIKLTNAHVISFKQNVNADRSGGKNGLLEDIKFSYQKSEMTDASGVIINDDPTQN